MVWALSLVCPTSGKSLKNTLLTTECRMNHEHSKLAYLNLSRNKITDDDLSILTEFLENAHGVCLKNLHLSDNEITSVGISKFCYVLSQEACNQLEVMMACVFYVAHWERIGIDLESCILNYVL